MNRRILLPVLVLLFGMTAWQCRRSKLSLPVLTGKLMVQAVCDHFIVQIQSGQYQPSQVVASWTDSENDSTYTNVFIVKNICSFAAARLPVGTVFQFTIDSTATDAICNTCDAAPFASPAASNTVTNIKVVPLD